MRAIVVFSLFWLGLSGANAQSLEDVICKHLQVDSQNARRTRSGHLDVFAFMNDRFGREIDPADNIAVDFFCMADLSKWPDDVRQRYSQLLSRPKKLNKPFVSYSDFAWEELRTLIRLGNLDEDKEREMLLNVDTEFWENLYPRAFKPWTTESLPSAGKWMEEFSDHLKLLSAASEKSKYFAPVIIDDNLQEYSIINIGKNDFFLALWIRAMNHLGEGRRDKCIADIKAMVKLAKLMQYGTCLHDRAFGIAAATCALEAIGHLLSSQQLTEEDCIELGKLLDDLNAPSMRNVLTFGEKTILGLELQRARAGHPGAFSHPMFTLKNVDRIKEDKRPINWATVGSMLFSHYDRLAEVSDMPNGPARDDAIDAIDKELEASGQLKKWMKKGKQDLLFIAENADPEQTLANILRHHWVIKAEFLSKYQFEQRVCLDLARIGFSIELFRRANGELPESLDNLVPDYLPAVPRDPYSRRPLNYRVVVNEYWLSSVGPNGKNDVEEFNYRNNLDDPVLHVVLK